jgi:hypothetical protein
MVLILGTNKSVFFSVRLLPSETVFDVGRAQNGAQPCYTERTLRPSPFSSFLGGAFCMPQTIARP